MPDFCSCTDEQRLAIKVIFKLISFNLMHNKFLVYKNALLKIVCMFDEKE